MSERQPHLDTSEITHEKHSLRPYSELGKGEDYINTWGVILYKGEPRSLYLDDEITEVIFTDEIIESVGSPTERPIRIGDFGGADGALIRTVTNQLREHGYQAVGAIVDASLKEGKTRESWDQYREQNPDRTDRIIAIPANFMTDQEKINLHDESLDIILSRFVTQYFPEAGRSDFFAAHARYLKADGRMICEWPGAADAESEKAMNEFWSGYANITQGIAPEEFRKVQHYPTMEQVQQAAEAAGLKVVKCEEVDGLLFNVYESMVSNGSRFVKFNDEQKVRLRLLFERLHEQYSNAIHYDQQTDNYYFKFIIAKLVVEKPAPELAAE